jgi:hypothetical protein
MILVDFDSAFYGPFMQRHTGKWFFSGHGEIILPEFSHLGKLAKSRGFRQSAA